MGDTTTTVLVPLPAASGDKLRKLSKTFCKRFADVCKKANVKCEGIPEVATTTTTHPDDGEAQEEEEETSLQFGFIKHKYDFECENVCTRIPRIRLDKKNSIYSASLKRVREFKVEDSEENLTKEVEEICQNRPSLQPDLFKNADKSKYWDWFLESGDEMFCLRHGDMTEIYQFGGATFEPRLINDGEMARNERKAIRDDQGGGGGGNIITSAGALPWTRGRAFWTPQGSMLTTTHNQGVRLWGGPDFHGIIRLKHSAVQYGSFSKNEEFVATCDDVSSGRVLIHSVITGECLAKLPVPAVAPHGATDCWPLICWSHNSRYMALHHPEGITIYEVPEMRKVQYTLQGKQLDYLPFKNSLFSWQPNSDVTTPAVLAVWTAFKNESAPSRLTLLEIPSMQILATRNIFSVGGLARTYWQSNGAQLALVTQVQKKLLGKKRINQTQLDIFTMRTAKNNSIDAHWLNIEHDVQSVVWADSKNRLAVLLGNSQVLFYALTPKSGLQLCGPPMDIPRDINTVTWSPLGTHFVLAACDAEDPTGTLWFGVCEETSPDSNTYIPKIIQKDERAKLRHVDWDPSGRYVATSVSSPVGSDHAYKTEGARGYTIWSSHGKAVYNQSVEKLHRFQWRLHPLVHITDAERDAVKKNMNKFSKAFEAEDAQRKMVRRQELMEKRKQQQSEIKVAVQEAQDDLMTIPCADEWIKAEKEREDRRCTLAALQQTSAENIEGATTEPENTTAVF